MANRRRTGRVGPDPADSGGRPDTGDTAERIDHRGTAGNYRGTAGDYRGTAERIDYRGTAGDYRGTADGAPRRSSTAVASVTIRPMRSATVGSSSISPTT